MDRRLLVGNRNAGTGLEPGFLERLAGILEADLQIVGNHRDARQATASWLAGDPESPVVIAAGGGGTLRALVEAVMAAKPQAARITGLRLGSGNVIPRRYGIPRDPVAAAHLLKERIEAGTTRPCAVMRCTFGHEAGPRHGITMCGLGHFGRTSGDLKRFHERAGAFRRHAAQIVPLERLNDAEYVSSFLARMAIAALVPTSSELVEVDGRRFRLLAGVVLTRAASPDLTYHLVPRYGRPLSGRLQPGQELPLTLLDRRHTEFFLDEDPEQATGAITVEAAGTLDFVA